MTSKKDLSNLSSNQEIFSSVIYPCNPGIAKGQSSRFEIVEENNGVRMGIE